MIETIRRNKTRRPVTRSIIFLLSLIISISCSEQEVEEPLGNLTVSGTAWSVAYERVPIPGAEISILEYPGLRATTDSNGEYSITGLRPGSEVTLRLDHSLHTPCYNETFTMGETDLEKVSFQVPLHIMFLALAAISETQLDQTKGHIASTIASTDPSEFDDLWLLGEPGCTVTIDPPLPERHGPIYFDERTFPQRHLTETTADGGILYVNVPPGEYTVTAHKDGLEFRQIRMKVFARTMTNAPPPHGLRILP